MVEFGILTLCCAVAVGIIYVADKINNNDEDEDE